MTLTERIIAATTTKSEALHLLHDLEVYVRRRVFKSSDLEDDKVRQFDSLFLQWGEDFFKTFTVDNLDSEFRLAEEEITANEPITVYTPVALTLAQASKLVRQIRKDFGQDKLLDLRVDESLISGCAIVWEDKYHDYSLKGEWSKIEGIIAKKLHSPLISC